MKIKENTIKITKKIPSFFFQKCHQNIKENAIKPFKISPLQKNLKFRPKQHSTAFAFPLPFPPFIIPLPLPSPLSPSVIRQ